MIVMARAAGVTAQEGRIIADLCADQMLDHSCPQHGSTSLRYGRCVRAVITAVGDRQRELAMTGRMAAHLTCWRWSRLEADPGLGQYMRRMRRLSGPTQGLNWSTRGPTVVIV